MKLLFATTFSFLALSACAQPIQKGDNLQTVYKQIETPYYFKAPPFTVWAEGKDMLLIGDQPSANKCNYLLIALQDTTLIGVFEGVQLKYFLFDTEGNSVASTKSEDFLLPAWTVKRHSKIDPSDKGIAAVLEEMYDATLQENNGHLSEETIRKYQQYKTDQTLANRHIALLFDTYQTIITDAAAKQQKPPAEICVPLIKDLANESQKLYKQVPTIVDVYLGEALASAGMTEEARRHFSTALGRHPNSIPLQVYNYRMETDKDKQKLMLTRLKKNNKQHWMIKTL